MNDLNPPFVMERSVDPFTRTVTFRRSQIVQVTQEFIEDNISGVEEMIFQDEEQLCNEALVEELQDTVEDMREMCLQLGSRIAAYEDADPPFEPRYDLYEIVKRADRVC